MKKKNKKKIEKKYLKLKRKKFQKRNFNLKELRNSKKEDLFLKEKNQRIKKY